jgi:hypothetical protein
MERYPQVLHLPASHIWQMTPSLASSSPTPHPSGSALASPKSCIPSESLVVTLELHVREDLGDNDVLTLTRWAWEQCVSALWNPERWARKGSGGYS